METMTSIRDGFERTLLHSLIWNEPANFLEVVNGLSADCFSSKRFGELFEVLRQRYLDHKPLADAMMVAQDMVDRGYKDFTAAELFTLSTETTLFQNMREYALTIINMHRRQKLEFMLKSLIKKLDDTGNDLSKIVADAVEKMLTGMDMSEEKTIRLTDGLQMADQRMQDNRNGVKREGFLTGFQRLDIYGGLHPGDLIVIAADSSQGKTSLAINMLVTAARESGAKAVVYSMEMSALQLSARILSPETNLPASVIIHRKLTDNTYLEAQAAIEGLKPIADNIFFGDSAAQTVSSICSSIRLHHVRFGINMVVVDYLQIIGHEEGWNGKTEEALAEAARRLKNLAKELNIVVLLLSQLNREGASMGNNVPSASRLRGSGQINEASDLTILIYRPIVYGLGYPHPFENADTKNTAMLKVDKDRFGAYGGLGTFLVHFDGKTTKFSPLEEP